MEESNGMYIIHIGTLMKGTWNCQNWISKLKLNIKCWVSKKYWGVLYWDYNTEYFL